MCSGSNIQHIHALGVKSDLVSMVFFLHGKTSAKMILNEILYKKIALNCGFTQTKRRSIAKKQIDASKKRLAKIVISKQALIFGDAQSSRKTILDARLY